MYAYEIRPIALLKAHSHNARQHSKKQIKALANSIRRFGFVAPVVVTDDNFIVAGHARVEAAKLAALNEVPVICFSGKTPDEVRAYVLADNQHALKSAWDFELLASELTYLMSVDLEIETTGFEIPEIDLILTKQKAKKNNADFADDLPDHTGPVISREGDVWLMNDHRLIVGDSQSVDTFERLMAGEKASMVLSDAPYNVRIDGNVSGLEKRRHDEFAFASGEMSEVEFTQFLSTFFRCSVSCCAPGSLLYVFMDWRHVFELLSAARDNKLSSVNMCVWNKTNAGMGSFYRSKHELCFIFKHGNSAHRNNVELGKHGRSRTNVWDYAGANSFKKGRMADLNDHPTVKPAEMFADAIRDASAHGDIILDPFSGSGTIVIAAEMTGRRARAIEIDPGYADVTLRRFEAFTGKKAVLESTSETFETLAEKRAVEVNGEEIANG